MIRLNTLLFFSLLFITVSGQTPDKNPLFSNSCLDYEFYNCLIKNGKPVQCAKTNSVPYMYFHEKYDSVFIGSLVEGSFLKYDVKNYDTLLVFGQDGRILYSITVDNSKDSLILLENNLELKSLLVNLGSEYNSLNAYQNFINGICVAGTYSSSVDSTVKITFFQDGRIEGYKDYDRYLLISQIVDTPVFDLIIFIKDHEYKDYYHWKRSGQKLKLHSIIDPDSDSSSFSDWEISEKHIDFNRLN